jgi:flagellar biosynthetic protein FlhB
MAEDDDDSQKTEEPSERRLEEAKEKGQSFSSKEIGNFLIMLSLTFSIGFISPKILKNLTILLSSLIENSYIIDLDESTIAKIITKFFLDSYIIIIVPLILTFLIAVLSNYIQHGEFNISIENIMPKLEKISPISGFGRIFSSKSFIEFTKNIVKLIIVISVCYLTIEPKLSFSKSLYDYSIAGNIWFLLKLLTDLLTKITIILGFIAAIDYFYQRFEFYKSLRMSKQDIKDEYKQTEGNPEIKSKIRSLRYERSRNRMMSQVPSADVVITNPTHYSIAIKYDLKIMNAPVIVAKGKDLIALKIREIAKINNIPLVENQNLARILYKSVDIDQEIPVEHYKAVAEVINYVYKLKRKFN